MANAISPVFKIFYNQKDITTDISEFIISVRYLDRMFGETDEIEILLEDSAGFWANEWYPTKGDTLKLQMGYDERQLDCGTFEIDEIEHSGPPSTINIRAMATWVTSAMRTPKTRMSDGITLKEIAQQIATNQGLKLVGDIFTVRLAHSMQNNETDLAYLNRLGLDYGFVFSVRNRQLIFTSLYDQEDANKNRPVYSVDVTDMLNYSFRDTTSGMKNAIVSSYFDPKTGSTITKELRANQEYIDTKTVKDVGKTFRRVEDDAQAELRARSILQRANTPQQSGRCTIQGYPLAVAGNNIEVTGLGKISGVYHIMSSEHVIDKTTGYVTNLELKRIGFVDKVKNKPKKPSLKTQTYRVVNETTVGQ